MDKTCDLEFSDGQEKYKYKHLMTKPILFFDMDNVLVNFQSGIDKLDDATKQAYEGHIDDVQGIFAKMDPMPGAIEAVHKLAEKYDVYILSTAPWKNPTALNDKLEWVKIHFGGEKDSPFYKRLIFTHHKDLCHGDYLIDDRPSKCGAGNFSGELIHFGSPVFPDWDAVVEYLMHNV